MRRFFFSITGLLFTGALAIGCIPLGLLIFWVTQNAVNEQFEAVREKHLIVAQNLAFALSRYAQDAASEFEVVAQSSDADLSYSVIKESAKQFHFRFFASFDASGVQTKSIIFDDQIKDIFVDKDLFSLLKLEANKDPGKILFSGILAHEGKPHIWIVRTTSSEELQTVLMRPDYLVKTQKAIAFGERGHSMIVDQYGRVIAHPNAQWEATSKDASKLSVVQKMMAGETGVSQFYSPPMEADMIAGHTFVPETGWGVMVPQPVEELYDAAKRFQMVAFAIAIAGLFVSLVLSWWLSKRIGGSVARLSSASKELIESGDLSQRVALPQSGIPNEVVALSISYNEMLNRIEMQSMKLEIALEKSEESNKAKSEFLATVTHELRTPMNGIIGSLELIKDASDLKEVREYSDLAMSSSHHLIDLIDDVLLYSSVEAGKIEVKNAPFDPKQLIEEVVDLFRKLIKSKEIELIHSVSEGLPDSVIGDKKRLRQILVNVVGNAMKFTESGSVKVCSHYDANDAVGPRLRITVSDTGIGIPSQKLPYIFDRFYQIDSSFARREGGAGLGLAISRELSDLLGGNVSVESDEGKGSKFTIDVPLKTDQIAS